MGFGLVMSDFTIESYEKKLLKFQEEHPYDCIPALAVDWLSKDNRKIYNDMMSKYPYNDGLEMYKREHAHQSPEEAEIEFTLLHPEWSILIHEDSFYDSLDNISDDYDPILNDKTISLMDFMEITDVVFSIDDDYLDSHIDILLEDENIVMPPFLLKYLYNHFPDKMDELDSLVSRYESLNLISDFGLKFVRNQVSTYKPMEETFLLFEIFEFTCNHLDYEDMLLETTVKSDK